MKDKTKVPRHIAIICDGNRRWAKKRKLPSIAGHLKGLRQVKELIKFLRRRKVEVVTLYAFSTENWKRSEKEVKYLMALFSSFVKKNINYFRENGGRLKIIGDLSRLPKFLQRSLTDGMQKTKKNSSFLVQIALNYGGRDEIVRAVNKLLQNFKKSKVAPPVTETDFSKFLDTANVPDPDLIIRTSGEQRLSNFLPWQGVYSEIFFAQDYLPDFTPEKMEEVLRWYEKRKRRFGS